MEEDKERRRLREASKGNLKRVGWGVRGDFGQTQSTEGSSACSSYEEMEKVWQMVGGEKTSREHTEEAEEKGGTSEEWHRLLD